MDTSQLITYLPAYIFPDSKHALSMNLVLGVSLGGHAAWHCILHEPRIKTAVIVIGCPDYTSLMADRARLSKLKTWTESKPPGSAFVGSRDFPPALVKAVESYDPAGFFSQSISTRNDPKHKYRPPQDEQEEFDRKIWTALHGKRILNLAGGADRLVPYSCGKAFLDWLKERTGPCGSVKDVLLEDMVFGGVGHEMNPAMVTEAIRFIGDSLDADSSQNRSRI
jgi:pimeloyl-ACP methyl ester carboxylesterase